MADNESCATCRHAYALEEWDFSDRGCVHTPMNGYICMVFADERKAVWVVGTNSAGYCEGYERMVSVDD